MKFSSYLKKNLTPEWSSQYIAYDYMKGFLYENQQNSSTQQYYLNIEEEFFQCCTKQLTKVNTFFAARVTEKSNIHTVNIYQYSCISSNTTNYDSDLYFRALMKFDALKEELENVEKLFKETFNKFTDKFYFTKFKSNIIQHQSMKQEKINILNDFKLAYAELYLLLTFLKNYQALNFVGFCKILKKYDIIFKTEQGSKWRRLHVDCAIFYTSQRIDDIMIEVEILYANVFESGDRIRTLQCLRVPPLEEKQPRIVTFRLGVYVGMVFVLVPILITIGFALFGSHSSKSINWRAGVHLYRSSFLIILNLILFGINMYIWSKNGINYVLIFGVDPRNHLTYEKFLEIGMLLMIFWFISFISFLLAFHFDFNPFLHPFLFLIFLLLFLVNPFPIFYHQSRRWFLRTLLRIFSTPFISVKFTDFWVANQLSSLELVFFDIEFLICFYTTTLNWNSSKSTKILFCSGWSQISLQILLKILPSWFRFAQCLRRYYDTKRRFPDLVNAAKYSIGFLVSTTNALRRAKNFDYHHHKLENPFFYLWIVSSLVSSTWKVIWDFKIAWGIFDINCGNNKYLRSQLLYPKKIYYYIAIFTNITFRYLWMITIFIHFESLSAEYSDLIGLLFGIIELFRRFIWNIFRLENEQLNNCESFRAVRDISIRPITITNNLRLHKSVLSQEINDEFSVQRPAVEHRSFNEESGTIEERHVNEIHRGTD